MKEEDVKRVIYRRGKRATKKKLNKKKLFGLILLFAVIVIICIEMYSKKESNAHATSDTSVEITNETTDNNTVSEEEKNIVDVDIPDTVGGYNVLGQLVLEKIGVTQNILDRTEDDSLRVGVTKFYGPKINQAGNFCICGHNYTGILKDLKEMNEGDEFYIISKDTKERVDYKIYDMYSCEPTDLSCLKQNQDGKREVTLITCDPGGLTRLICKAREM